MSQRPQLFGKTLFVDLMMSTLVVVTALLIASNAAEKAKNKQALEDANMHVDGVLAVTIKWDDASNDDVDLYVKDPHGNICYFGAQEVPLMNLERDDQGTATDKVDLGTGTVIVRRNGERIVIRGAIPGEYVVNVHMYSKRDPVPTSVTGTLFRLKGDDAELVTKQRELSVAGDERTMFRFTLSASGDVANINELETELQRNTPRGRMGR